MNMYRMNTCPTEMTEFTIYKPNEVKHIFETNSKIALIICNDYVGTSNSLGDIPMKDAELMYKTFSQFNYKVVVVHNITCNQYRYLLKLCSIKLTHLIIYYIGHGTQIHDTNGDESDNLDECLFFSDGLITDDESSSIIEKYKQCDKLTLFSDCCHSGTIYDIPDRGDVVCISACLDTQTAKQINNGMFTYYLSKYLKQFNDTEHLTKALNQKLSIYDQFVITNTHDDNIIMV